MMDWFNQLPVVWMSLIVVAGIGVVTALIYVVVLALAARGWAPAFKAVSPVMLTPLAVVFGLIVGFLAAQVWNDGERANSAVIREASALRTVLLLATIFPDQTEARIRTLVRRHIQDAVDKEWPAMARQQTSLPTINPIDIEALEVLVHSDNRRTAAIAMALFAIGMASCVVLIASHNEPFTGEISVSPSLLLQVMPKE